MRKRYVQIDGELIEVGKDYSQPVAPTVIGDIESYESPASGKMIEGRAQRREDFKRTNTRPWEGLAEEKKEAARQRAYQEQQLDKSLDKAAWTAFYNLPPEKRRRLIYS